MGENNIKRFHIDGAGQRPDGKGSGYAWVWLGTGKQGIKWQDRLSSNAAEFQALLMVLRFVANGSHLEIFSDSTLLVQQFTGAWSVNDPKLAALLLAARDLIDGKDLEVAVKWIPRELNLAGKILERKGRRVQAG